MKKLSFIAIGVVGNFVGLLIGAKALKAFDLAPSSYASITVLLLALIATSAIHYALTYAMLRDQAEQEAEDKLFSEIEQDQPRRFDEANFK